MTAPGSVLLWRLSSSTARVAACYLQPLADGTHELRVVRENSGYLREFFESVDDAIARAAEMSTLLSARGWQERVESSRADPVYQP